MVHRADVARRIRADATQHARPHGRAARAHATHRWRDRVAGATRVHAYARVAPRGKGAGK